MFTNILVPLDFSSDSERGLAAASELARLTGGRLTLCSVVMPLGPADQEDVVRLETMALDRARVYLGKQEAEAHKQGVANTSIIAERGDAADVVLGIAARERCDLIAMSSHGIGRAYKYPLGSVALRVLMAAPCPVLTVRTSPGAASG